MTTIYSPIDGNVLAEVEPTSAADVALAVEAATAAAPAWAATNPQVRRHTLERVAELMLEREEELATIEAKNLGAPYPAALGMVRRAASSFTYFSQVADQLAGEVLAVQDGFHTLALREPHGVVAAVVPWNAPIIFATKKLAPALAFGNAAILKPAPETPLSALLLEQIMHDAGLPRDVVRVLPGERETGEALTGHADVDLIVFTGSDATGAAIASAAGRALVPTAMELGGKSAQLVFDDAPVGRTVDGLLSGIFGNAGQACVAGSRILIQEGIAEQVLPELVRRTRELRVGDPFESGTQMGPQATAGARDKSLRMIEEALEAGASVLAQGPTPSDGKLEGGYWVPPTLLGDIDDGMAIVREEVFGPVAIVETFSTEEEGIERANSTEFGLAGGIWSANSARAHRVAKALRAGTVWVNTYGVISDRVPFGGSGRSGYGREGGHGSVETYTRTKAVWTSTADDAVTADILLP